MTAKFEAFKAALEALCIEHGVRLSGGDDGCSVSLPSDSWPVGLAIELDDCLPLTEQERKERDARDRAKWARWEEQRLEARAADELKYRAAIDSGDYVKLRAIIDADAAEQRKKQMRVTRIPGDAHDIGNKTCRVWCNEVEILDWTAADDFRRIVEAPGRVLHGAVRIEIGKGVSLPAGVRIEVDGQVITQEPQPVGFHGLVVYTPDEPAVEAPAEPAPTFAAPAVKVAPKHIPARKRKGSK
jgi:hypothetical protein